MNKKRLLKRWGICLLISVLSAVAITATLYFKIGEYYETNAGILLFFLAGSTLLSYTLFEGIYYVRIWASNKASLHPLIKTGVILEGLALVCLATIVISTSLRLTAAAEITTHTLICAMAILAVLAEAKLKDRQFLIFEVSNAANTLLFFWLMLLHGTMN